MRVRSVKRRTAFLGIEIRGGIDLGRPRYHFKMWKMPGRRSRYGSRKRNALLDLHTQRLNLLRTRGGAQILIQRG
jgi:hypothetical protein